MVTTARPPWRRIVETAEGDWAESTLLGRLGETDRTALLAAGTIREFPNGRRLIQQGATDDHAYLLLRGRVKVAARDHNGRSALLGIRLAGDLVGEMAALDRPAMHSVLRSADVTTCGPVVAKVIKSADLHALMRRKPEISLGVVRMVTSRLRWASERRVDVASRARARVARILYDVVQGYGSSKPTHWELGVPLIQSEIASLSGVSLRTVQKTLRDLHDDGVLIRKYGTIHVIDLDALRRIAEV
jgi:CRP/FNR family transcriptional regulator, cyclic AMP receptor protein